MELGVNVLYDRKCILSNLTAIRLPPECPRYWSTQFPTASTADPTYVQAVYKYILPNIALSSPSINSSTPLSTVWYMLTSMMPFLIVSPTLAPMNTAPAVSKMVARRQACSDDIAVVRRYLPVAAWRQLATTNQTM